MLYQTLVYVKQVIKVLKLIKKAYGVTCISIILYKEEANIKFCYLRKSADKNFYFKSTSYGSNIQREIYFSFAFGKVQK